MSTFDEIAGLIDSGYSVSEALRKHKDGFLTEGSLDVEVSSITDPSTGRLKGISIKNHDITTSALSGILFQAYDEGAFIRHGAGIVQGKDGAWISPSFPGFLSFWTRPTLGDQIEALRLDSSQNATFGGNVSLDTQLNIANIPTSSAGLSAGDVWSNSGVLTIV